MSGRVRLIVFLVAAAGFAALFVWGVIGLPDFGKYQGPYGNVLNKVAVPQRHGTDVVTDINFDYRAFDTIGEEFILFVSVAGVALLLRTERDETDVEPPEDESALRKTYTSNAIRALCLFLVAPAFVLGWYIVTHGQLTPGGGFQGGAVLASALILLYLAGGYKTFRRLGAEPRSEVPEAIGAGGFVLIGFAGLLAGATFLENIVPLGPVGLVYSGGTIPLISLSIGIEVGGGFLVILAEFLRQALQVRESARAREQEQEEQ